MVKSVSNSRLRAAVIKVHGGVVTSHKAGSNRGRMSGSERYKFEFNWIDISDELTDQTGSFIYDAFLQRFSKGTIKWNSKKVCSRR